MCAARGVCLCVLHEVDVCVCCMRCMFVCAARGVCYGLN